MPVKHVALTQAFKNTCETLPKLKWKTSVKHYLKSDIEKTCETSQMENACETFCLDPSFQKHV